MEMFAKEYSPQMYAKGLSELSVALCFDGRVVYDRYI
jgi:hypothetical protein